MPFPDKKYKVIYADPPWSYNNKALGKTLTGGAEYHYDTMSLEQIKALPVTQLADKAACLFLWVVNPQLPEGLEVMQAWGFKYKTCLTWYKTPANGIGGGLGYWFRGHTEHLLLGIKGSVPAFHCQERNIIISQLQEHSRKPQRFRALIERATKNIQPRIELFARQKAMGWDAWGNQVEDLPTLEQYAF